MKTPYKHIIILLLCLTGFGAQCQNSYLLNFGHRASRDTENLFFYLEELQPGAAQDRTDVITLEDAVYRVHLLHLTEPSASTYMGCSKYSNQAAGELLSLRHLLTDSVLRAYEQKQEAIEAKCMSLLDNRGRHNAVFTIEINEQDHVKMVKMSLDICSCKTSGPQFSTMTDTLAMVRKIQDTSVFTEAEKSYWHNHIGSVLDNAFVKSCLPPPDRFAKAYQASRE